MTRKKKSKNIVTAHSSKGLEWDVAFVPNVNEELFPHRMNVDSEEERRLFYVACSRPRKQLFVSWWFYDTDMEKINEGFFSLRNYWGKEKVMEMKKVLFRGATEVLSS
ncbi:3'-5' exonuclease [Peribacillus simplex]|uniref:3'-5' exonuclease n=2 Tax=Peribacillus TaxID=2675229 RepID=A0AA90PNI3_9BACI|nr:MULTISPECIES: 3'-5' exonuclease [Peribacillus]MDP1421153.1 3'-5' exonuclease [Peribacillus simplex]MDP1453920.1 3'-5' exonuclease [Peribacillus frigoritolerans]